MLYYNARSILPKFDDLCALVEAFDPDVVSFVESWLCDDVPDSEIALAGFQLFRNDRNRHGGGVMVYVKLCFSAVLLPCGSDLEVVPVVLRCFNLSFCVIVFYRPPNSPSSIFDTLSTFVGSLNVSRFFDFVVIGDFNVNMKSLCSPLYQHVRDFMDLFRLSLVVDDVTHTSSRGAPSIIDLVLASSPSIASCSSVPPLANSDHMGLSVLVNLGHDLDGVRSSGRSVWRYAYADFDLANVLINDVDWGALVTDDVDDFCLFWQSTFLSIMEQCIPRSVLPDRRRNLPWLTKPLLQCIRRKNALYRRVKHSSCVLLHLKYKQLRNRVTSLLRSAKHGYFSSIDPSDTRSFWKLVNVLNRRGVSVGAVKCGEKILSPNFEKADALNVFFSTCFNTTFDPISAVPRVFGAFCS